MNRYLFEPRLEYVHTVALQIAFVTFSDRRILIHVVNKSYTPLADSSFELILARERL